MQHAFVPLMWEFPTPHMKLKMDKRTQYDLYVRAACQWTCMIVTKVEIAAFTGIDQPAEQRTYFPVR